MYNQSQIEQIKTPGRFRVAETLFLVISPGGSKSWVQRINQDGKRIERGLGGYPAVTIKQAKEKALENRTKKRLGESIELSNGIPTFRQLAMELIAKKRTAWGKPEVMHKKWMQCLALHVFPFIGSKKITGLKPLDFEGIITKLLMDGKRDQAEVTKKYVKAIMQHAVDCGHILFNPVNVRLPKRTEVKNYAALHYSELSNLLKNMKTWKCREVTKQLLEFQALTAVRPSEARLAEWSEIDFNEKVWTIPASKMKMKKAHRVPLSNRAVEILQEMASKTSENAQRFVFHNKGKAIGRTVVTSLLLRAQAGTVAHGFRSSFRSWCADHSVPFEVAEKALAHDAGSVVNAYQRSDLIEQRREVMQAWSDYLIR